MLTHIAYRTFGVVTRDLQDDGATLGTILAAGEWRSQAFMSHLDSEEVESAAVIEAHVCESSEDESGEEDSAIVDLVGDE